MTDSQGTRPARRSPSGPDGLADDAGHGRRLEIRDRCPALTSVMWAPARLAMNVCSAGGMTRSPVPITAHDGMVFQAGGPDGSENALAVSDR